ncbi:MAG: RHS repeat-associated core domain-containing protein [Verrucomicrobiota bacterium]
MKSAGRPAALLASADYTYDPASRLLSVSDGTHSATYAYLTNLSRVRQITFARTNVTRMTTTRTYDDLQRLTSVVSTNAPYGLLDAHAYGYNQANQRVVVTNTDNSYWIYEYDALGQVTSGLRYWANGTPVVGQYFTYKFDNIGNRTRVTYGGIGTDLRQSVYRANPLNQYTSRSVPGHAFITGSADVNATVSVNGDIAWWRQGQYFCYELAVDNKADAVWQPVEIIGALGSAPNPDLVTTNNGHVFVPRVLEQYTYDADGNLLTDGRWQYTWDGENRLVKLQSLAYAPVGSERKLEFAYDAGGRRIQKKSYWYNYGTQLYQLSADRRFVYDGWNVVAELEGTNVLRSYVWGSDLSGSEQGAGGVGGLLAVRYHAAGFEGGGGTHFAAFDGNGNITALVRATDGAVSARNEYGPFGERIRDGLLNKMDLCPFGFSTKYTDDETDLVYYGYRFYNPTTGRWLNRDPIEEFGGKNLYCFALNNSILFVDRNGLDLSMVFLDPDGVLDDGWEDLTVYSDDPSYLDQFDAGDVYYTQWFRQQYPQLLKANIRYASSAANRIVFEHCKAKSFRNELRINWERVIIPKNNFNLRRYSNETVWGDKPQNYLSAVYRLGGFTLRLNKVEVNWISDEAYEWRGKLEVVDWLGADYDNRKNPFAWLVWSWGAQHGQPRAIASFDIGQSGICTCAKPDGPRPGPLSDKWIP